MPTLTPLTTEVAVSAPTSSAGRNTSVAHFLAPHWGRIADRLRADQYAHFRGESWLRDWLDRGAGAPRPA